MFSLDGAGRLLAVVDWEMATLGDPLADLGWLLAFWREAGERAARACRSCRASRGSRASRPGPSWPRATPSRPAAPLPDLTLLRRVRDVEDGRDLLEGHWARHVRGTAGGFDFAYLERGGPRLWQWVRGMAELGPGGAGRPGQA